MKRKKFFNQIQPFTISGTYSGKNIDELYLDCSMQMCSTKVDFFPEWKVRKNKLILELTPKLVKTEPFMKEKMTIFKEGKTSDYDNYDKFIRGHNTEIQKQRKEDELIIKKGKWVKKQVII